MIKCEELQSSNSLKAVKKKARNKSLQGTLDYWSKEDCTKSKSGHFIPRNTVLKLLEEAYDLGKQEEKARADAIGEIAKKLCRIAEESSWLPEASVIGLKAQLQAQAQAQGIGVECD